VAEQIKLNSPRYRVVLGDPDDPETWQALEVQSITRDITAAETLFATHKSWGKMMDSPIRLTALSAFYGLRRTGQIEGSWESFEQSYIEVNQADADAVDPTQPEADSVF
jgi:hypothetical protein